MSRGNCKASECHGQMSYRISVTVDINIKDVDEIGRSLAFGPQWRAAAAVEGGPSRSQCSGNCITVCKALHKHCACINMLCDSHQQALLIPFKHVQQHLHLQQKSCSLNVCANQQLHLHSLKCYFVTLKSLHSSCCTGHIFWQVTPWHWWWSCFKGQPDSRECTKHLANLNNLEPSWLMKHIKCRESDGRTLSWIASLPSLFC